MRGRRLLDLRDTVVAVTGGARGIGLATAAALAARGARVSIGDVDGDHAASAAERLGAHGAPLDVRNVATFAGFLEETERALGPLYALVNNAGVMPMGAFLEEDEAVGDLQIDINLRGELRGTGVHVTVVLPSRVATELAAGTRGGRGLPTVTAEDVAAAIIRALERPRPAVTVPRWLRPAPALYGLAPERLRALVRRAIHDDRILTELDRSARAGYEERVAGLAAPSPHGPPQAR